MRKFVRKFLLLCIVPLCCLHSQGKNANLAISPLSDSLVEYTLTHPMTTAIRETLIREYLANDEPELAALEFLDYTAKDTISEDMQFRKGLMFLKMERYHDALSALTDAYLLKPSLEKLKYLALTEYCNGNEDNTKKIYDRLRGRNIQTSGELYSLFCSAYILNKKSLLDDITNFFRKFDSKEYARLFPNPIVSVTSPEDNYLTEETELSGLINIRHDKAIKSVEMNGKVIFKKTTGDSLNIQIKKEITVPLHLAEGRNSYAITATDVLGYTGKCSFSINCLNFKKKAGWAAKAADSLQYRFRYLKSFVPEEMLSSRPFERYRLLLCSFSPDADSQYYFQNGLFWYELLTNQYCGSLPHENVKLVLQERAQEENIKMLFSRWLLKNMTMQSVPVVYLGGKWDVKDGKWLMKMNSGLFDVKPFCASLLTVANSGVLFIIDGVINNREMLRKEIHEMVSTAGVGVGVLIMPGTDISRRLTALLTEPDSSRADSSQATLMPGTLNTAMNDIETFTNDKGNIPFLHNPAAVITANHASLADRLPAKLKTDKVPAAKKNKIVSFLDDWRRYSELTRYLNGELSITDLLSQIDEFESRKGKEGNE